MNKKILYLSLAVVVLILCASSVTAFVSPPPGIKDPTLSKVWAAIMDLQTQIKNIQTTPGPTGPTGPAGKDGKDGAQGPAGATVHFGPAQDINVQGQTTYYATAATDGIVMLRCRNLLGGDVLAAGTTWDGTTSTNIIDESEWSASSTSASITMPVASGESWFVNWRDCEANLYWRPLIS
jgi:hypothetical protein